MPKKLPPEFKRVVVMVARRGDLTIPEVAVDFDGEAITLRAPCSGVPKSS